jgi:hypothetical protein
LIHDKAEGPGGVDGAYAMMLDAANSATDDPGAATIEVWLAKVQQLFNSFDPSPFLEKDLDRDAEEYIVGTADELPPQRPLRLVIHLPADQRPAVAEFDLEKAIRNYFAYRLEETRRNMRSHFREGRAALTIGVVFLVVCMTIRQLAFVVPGGTAARIVQEGLLILGWVAMWRPLQVMLYDWWPIRHRARLYARLAAMPVEVRTLRGE